MTIFTAHNAFYHFVVTYASADHFTKKEKYKKKAFELMDRKGLTTRFTGESIAMTRAFCFINPDKSMKGIAIDNFNYILDAVAKKMNHDMVSK